jgi:hypothetical protein
MPRPVAWVSAAALSLFAAGVSASFALAVPRLIALIRHSPRLAWLGMLLLWLSPIAVVAALHALVGRFIAGKTSGPREPRLIATSWWAGFVAWATILMVSMTMAFVAFVIDPPPVGGPDSVWNVAATVIAGVTGTTRSLIWIVLAAYVYELDLRARPLADTQPPRSPNQLT